MLLDHGKVFGLDSPVARGILRFLDVDYRIEPEEVVHEVVPVDARGDYAADEEAHGEDEGNHLFDYNNYLIIISIK